MDHYINRNKDSTALRCGVTGRCGKSHGQKKRHTQKYFEDDEGDRNNEYAKK